MNDLIARSKGYKNLKVTEGQLETELFFTGTKHVTTPFYELADIGKGIQLVRLRANNSDIVFEQFPICVIQLINQTTEDLSISFNTFQFPLSTIAESTPTHFKIIYATSNISDQDFILYGDLNLTTGELAITWDSNIPSSIPGYAVYAVKRQFKIKPYETNNPEEMFAFLPTYGGQLIRNACNQFVSGESAGEIYGINPALFTPYPATSYVDVVTTQFSYQLMYFYHRTQNCGIAVRTDDGNGRGKWFHYNGDDTNIYFGTTEFPTNNLQTRVCSSNYNLILRPMRGNWFDACKWYRESLENESKTWISRGKIVNMVDGDVDDISKHVKDADIFFWGSITTANERTRFVEEFKRIVAYYGSDLKYIVSIYRWQVAAITELYPDLYPPNTHAMSAIDDIIALYPTVRIVWYSIPECWAPNSNWYTTSYNPSYGAPANSIILKATQTPYTQMLDQALQTLYYPQFGNANCRSHTVDILSQITTKGHRCDGIYLDALSGSYGPYGDYRTSLSSSQKGPGSDYWTKGKVECIRQIKSNFRTTQAIPDFVIFSEILEEDVIHHLDFISTYSFILSSADIFFVPGWNVIYSQYIITHTFNETITYLPNSIKDDFDLLMYGISKVFHCGSIISYAWFGDLTAQFLIPQQNDSVDGGSYYSDNWTKYDQYRHAFLKKLNRARHITHGGLYKYFTGKRLRSLYNNWEERLERVGPEFTVGQVVTDGAIGIVIVGADVMSSVWQANTGNRDVTILMTNYKQYSSSFSVTVSVDQFSEITGNLRYLFRRNSDGTRTLIKSFYGHFTEQVTIAQYDLDVLEISSAST